MNPILTVEDVKKVDRRGMIPVLGFFPPRAESIERCKEWILSHCCAQRYFNASFPASRLARLSHLDVTTGEFIVAALELGYEGIRDDLDRNDVQFRISWR